ncbi:MAG: hypothetical protein AAFQ65_02875 [Myxococcota bacterium]
MTDWLDEKMRDDVYIEDGGFADRVLTRLPAPRRVRRRRRSIVLVLSSVVGAALSLFVLPGGRALTEAFREVVTLSGDPSNVSALSIAVFALLVAGAVALPRLITR